MDDEEIFDPEEELEIEEELRGRRLICTCDENPDFCELHNEFA